MLIIYRVHAQWVIAQKVATEVNLYLKQNKKNQGHFNFHTKMKQNDMKIDWNGDTVHLFQTVHHGVERCNLTDIVGYGQQQTARQIGF